MADAPTALAEAAAPQIAPPIRDWRDFARAGDWGRAQAAASLTHADPDLHAAIAGVAAFQTDIRARRFAAARRALASYCTALGAAARLPELANDVALLHSLAAPQTLEAALRALDYQQRIAEPAELQAQLQPALAHALTEAEAHNALGILHALREEPQQAREQFLAALDADPGHYRARMNLGSLALEAGDAASAEAEFREVLKMAPEYEGVHHNLGVALRQQGKVAEGVKHIRRAQRLQNQRTRQDTRDDVQEQMRLNPQLRLIRAVVIGLILLVAAWLLLAGRH